MNHPFYTLRDKTHPQSRTAAHKLEDSQFFLWPFQRYPRLVAWVSFPRNYWSFSCVSLMAVGFCILRVSGISFYNGTVWVAFNDTTGQLTKTSSVFTCPKTLQCVKKNSTWNLISILIFFGVLTYAIIYVLMHQIILRFYLLKYSLFFQVLLY